MLFNKANFKGWISDPDNNLLSWFCSAECAESAHSDLCYMLKEKSKDKNNLCFKHMMVDFEQV